MDAGTAAVLGAMVGAVGTTAAAFATSWWGARSTERQLAAQERSARRQLGFDHHRERREPRRQAYADFIAQGRAVERALGRYQDAHVGEMDVFHQEVEKLDHLGTHVQLEGPESIIEPMLEVTGEAHRCIKPLGEAIRALEDHPQADERYRRSTTDDLAMAGLEFTAALKAFADAGRRALEADGTAAG
ncbi:hypothetical protein [Wenjunlia tyrosinilytica]|nr:hypothetical protein [Wenjunlia tyrosinilytica]